jgi:hypothetical protein
MGKKVYISLTGIQYTFPVKTKDKMIWVSFGGNQNDYHTSNKEVQEAIEGNEKFLNKQIELFSGKREEKDLDAPLEAKEFPEVIDLNDAVKILSANPYRVHHSKIKSAADVKAQAAALNVSFPNLVID